MKIVVSQLSVLDGPMIRFAVILTDDGGNELMIYPGWMLDVYREVHPPATRTKGGWLTRFTEVSCVFEDQLLEVLQQAFPEIEEILGPKQKRPKKPIAGEMKIREPKPRTAQNGKQVCSKRGYGLGHVYLRGRFWWIKYDIEGRPIYESSGSIEKTAAIELLKTRLLETVQPRT
jgi:hypothetical protein